MHLRMPFLCEVRLASKQTYVCHIYLAIAIVSSSQYHMKAGLVLQRRADLSLESLLLSILYRGMEVKQLYASFFI